MTSGTIFNITTAMNSAHRKTLSAIFAEPPPRTLEWRRIESLLIAAGCEMIEGAGSRVGFKRGGLRADFHRPHPGKEAKPYQVRAAREFFEQLEVKP
ncbi:MAG: type II toxin-antitoxin system HicA family toxin [Syntrophales bacterium]|nr:type II toxin-antitoxin system HicA family toxin [Syntrophales bacterium]